MSEPDLILDCDGLSKYFPEPTPRQLKDGTGRFLKALDGVSLQIERGKTLAVVGESGCGKTTLGRILAGAYPPTRGTIRVRAEGHEIQPGTGDRAARLRYLRTVQMVFQDPFSSLNPRMAVGRIIAEPLICHGWRDRRRIADRVAELLDQTGISPAFAERFPHMLSGGQRQRVVIARALALSPALIVADEAVSALDVSIQAQIINLLNDLQRRLGLTFLFISHDIGVVNRVSDRIAVMYVGRIVETGPTAEVLRHPKHPYTEALLSAVLRPDPNQPRARRIVRGEVVDPANRPEGCAFHPRCPYSQDVCRTVQPPLLPLNDGAQQTACHFAHDLALEGLR